jgi:hypothetical protein
MWLPTVKYTRICHLNLSYGICCYLLCSQVPYFRLLFYRHLSSSWRRDCAESNAKIVKVSSEHFTEALSWRKCKFIYNKQILNAHAAVHCQVTARNWREVTPVYWRNRHCVKVWRSPLFHSLNEKLICIVTCMGYSFWYQLVTCPGIRDE